MPESKMLLQRVSGKNKGNGSFLINSATNTKNDLKVELKRYFNELLAETADELFFISEEKCLKINQGLMIIILESYFREIKPLAGS